MGIEPGRLLWLADEMATRAREEDAGVPNRSRTKAARACWSAGGFGSGGGRESNPPGDSRPSLGLKAGLVSRRLAL
jgi:hypothetical protein